MITKLVFILFIAFILGCLKSTLLFIVTYGLIRSFSFGYHASSSLKCLLVASLFFLVPGYLIEIVLFPWQLVLFVIFLSFISIILFAPSGSKKRPINNDRKRLIWKLVSITIWFIYLIIIILSRNILFVNTIIFALIVNSIMINPLIYSIEGLSYESWA